MHSIPANECAAESSSVPLDLTATKLSEKGAWESLTETSSLRVVGKGAERMRERMAAVLDLRSVGSIWSESRRLFSWACGGEKGCDFSLVHRPPNAPVSDNDQSYKARGTRVQDVM